MIDHQTILAVILARGGSKGIPGKNIKPVAGKPLIGWTVKAARKSKYIDRVLVSTDSDEIAKVSKKMGADVPFKRPDNLASDTATSEDAIIHALEWIRKNEGISYENFILLQPTSPLRKVGQIDEAIEVFSKTSKADTLISVKKLDKHPNIFKKINPQGFLENYFKNSNQKARRQDMGMLYVPNGAIYIAKTDKFLKSKDLFKNCIPYLMDKISSVDMDDEEDLKIAEIFLQNTQ